jgi:uncharacterized membrane protein YkvA (DUF1232 family)
MITNGATRCAASISCTRWEPDIPTRKTPKKNGHDPDYEALKNALFRLWQELAPGTEKRFAAVVMDVEKHFAAAVAKIAAQDIAFVIEKRTDRAIAALKKNAPAWAQALPKQVQLLLELLREVMAGHFETNWKVMAAITATLQYLMNPLDLLQDALPGVGLMDDALMIGLCVATTRRDMARFAKQKQIRLADYGL